MTEAPADGPDRGPAQGSSAVVMTTHRLHPEVLERFRRLARDARPADGFLLCDRDVADPERLDAPLDLDGGRLVPFRKRDLASLPYPRKTAGDPFCIVPGNCDLVWLWFARRHPGYARYWFIEYDVEYTGSWSELFRHFADSQADLLSTTLYRHAHDPEWPHWEGLHAPADLGPSDRIRGFLPVVRLSRSALSAMDEAYRRGWGGHQEVVVPTVLRHRGLGIEDIGGNGPFVRPENRNRFYTNRAFREPILPETFVHRPARQGPGWRRGKLWHPVKPDQGRFLPPLKHLWRRVQGLLLGS